MAVTYCTAGDVGRLFQKTFGAGTNPTTTQVEAFINEAEDSIDRDTGHAFREITVTNEYHDFPSDADYGGYYVLDGSPVYLLHRKVRVDANGDIDTGSGDKLEVFDGANWIDWTATLSQDRAGDFWVEPDMGILWIRNVSSYPRRNSVRITYRYGESSVPNDIRLACILLAGILILTSDDRSVLLPDDTPSSQLTYDRKVEEWQKQYDNIVSKRAEFLTIGD